jgi:hypothetical protein
MALWLVVAGAAYDVGYRTAFFVAASLTTHAASTESTTLASSTDSTFARSTTFVVVGLGSTADGSRSTSAS